MTPLEATSDSARAATVLPSPYRLRMAGVADLPLILRHRRRMFEEMGHDDVEALDRVVAVSTPLIERGLRQGSYRGWLIESEPGLVVAGAGIIDLEFQAQPRDPRGRRSWVVNVFTEAEHRRRGLARWLMAEMIAWCRGSGMRELYLHASDDARPLYASLGFSPTNEMRLTL